MRVGVTARLVAALVIVASAGLRAEGDNDQDKQKPQVKIPESDVPHDNTPEGTYIRVAYNNECYSILGYRLANQSVGNEWMLIEFGTTLRDSVPDYTFKRDALSLETPDGKTIPLATIQEHRERSEEHTSELQSLRHLVC